MANTPFESSGKKGNSATRRRRRTRRPVMIDNTVPSPCQSICRFDGNPYCVGCYRNAEEIREWMIMSRERKLAVLEQLPARRRSAEDQPS